MRTARRIAAVTAVLAMLALGGAAASAPGAVQGRQVAAAPCDQLAARIAGLQAVREGVAAAVAELQRIVATGGLRPRQLTLAERLLGRLEDQLGRLDDRLARLQERHAAGCGGDGGGDGGGDDGGGGF